MRVNMLGESLCIQWSSIVDLQRLYYYITRGTTSDGGGLPRASIPTPSALYRQSLYYYTLRFNIFMVYALYCNYYKNSIFFFFTYND